MIKTLAGGLLAAGLAFGLAACGSAKVNAAAPPPTTAPPTTAPAVTTIQTQMVAWWATEKTPFTAIQNDLAPISAAAAKSDVTALAAGCGQLVTDVQTLQGDPPAPAPTVNTPLQAAMTAYAKAGAECQTGATTGDITQIDAAPADITVGDSELAQAVAAVNALTGT